MLSKKAVWEQLRSATFDPRKPGHLSVIVEDADADYLVERALEILRTWKTACIGDPKSQVRDAMSLLAYSQGLREASEKVTKLHGA